MRTLRELLEHRSDPDDRSGFGRDRFRGGEQPPMRELMALFVPDRVHAPEQVEFYCANRAKRSLSLRVRASEDYSR